MTPQDDPRPNRRLVLRRLVQASAVLGGAAALAALGRLSPGRFGRLAAARTVPDFRVPADPLRPTVFAAHGADPALLVRAALDKLGGVGRFVRPGDRVLIKPNMAWDRNVEQGANTHPAIVGEVVRQCRAAGARRVVVAENPVHDASRTSERSGIRRATLEAGGELHIPPAAPFLAADLHGTVLARWDLLGDLFEADKLISLPIVKDHALSRLTCVFKNSYGFLGGTRARLHQDIHNAIADLGAAIRPTLTIVDATRVLMRGGPTGGRLEDVARRDLLAAGTDPVALDAWSARVLGVDPAEIPYIALAEGRGLGRAAAAPAVGGETHVGA